MSVDPVEGGGDNTYVYVGDPVNESDLDGEIAPLAAFLLWQLGRLAVQQALKVAAKEAAKQAVKQVVKRTVVNTTRKAVQTEAKKSTAGQAAKLGYRPTKQIPSSLKSKGNEVFVNKKTVPTIRYISQDKTGHTGQNQWKGFNVKGQRTGTYKIVRGKLERFRK